jgi:predicted transcriptional regulator of viral defense system
MNRIAIIESEFSVLENAIVEYGNVVSFSQLQQLFKKDVAYTRKRVSRLVEQGWLTRIKKGAFVISDLRSREKLSISHQAIVNILVEDAYISFETALQYHGLYGQLLKSINSISLRRYSATVIDGY